MENSDQSSRTPAAGWEGYKLSQLSLIYDLCQAKLVTWFHLHLQDKDGKPLRPSVCVRVNEVGNGAGEKAGQLGPGAREAQRAALIPNRS